jgi:hypothetical protein
MGQPLILLCSDPLDAKSPDEAFRVEAQAVEEWALVSYEALVHRGDALGAIERVPLQPAERMAIYRGWMLNVDQYEWLYEALLRKRVRLVNPPGAYTHCHHLPECYPLLRGMTPESVWLPIGEISFERIRAEVKRFGSAPLIVKDYAKSRKHEWAEACFIPSPEHLERVVGRFLQLTGDDLQGGLVLRKFVELEPLARHARSGMPLVKEFRIFFFDGQPVAWFYYWDEGDYGGIEPPVRTLLPVARRIRSRFFTMDVARSVKGDWLIVELGDAQVAGLPESADVPAFYESLFITIG